MEPLRVMLVDAAPDRAALLEDTLRADGHRVIATLGPEADLAARVRDLAPDIIIIDMDAPNRDVLEHMRSISRDQPRPVVMFAEQSDSDTINTAIRAGVSAYVVDGLSGKRLRAIMEVAVARFQEFQALRRELEETRLKLSERKLVERAKGLLMTHRHMNEKEAFAALRKMAMDRNLRLGEAAQNVIAVFEMMG
ncbi:MAG: ANTAR domain-containing protein [Aquisalimonadaceae bacterium]